jgi:hypothetical protein
VGEARGGGGDYPECGMYYILLIIFAHSVKVGLMCFNQEHCIYSVLL